MNYDDEPMFEKTRYLRRGMKNHFRHKLLPKCTGKNTYPDKRTAEKIRRQQLNLGAVNLRIYKCPTCKLWHLTSKKKK